MGIFAWIGLGCIVGVIAGLLPPRRGLGDLLGNFCVGVGGGLVGGWVGTRIAGGATGLTTLATSGLVGAVIGAALLTFAHRLVVMYEERVARRRADVHEVGKYRKAA